MYILAVMYVSTNLVDRKVRQEINNFVKISISIDYSVFFVGQFLTSLGLTDSLGNHSFDDEVYDSF